MLERASTTPWAGPADADVVDTAAVAAVVAVAAVAAATTVSRRRIERARRRARVRRARVIGTSGSSSREDGARTVSLARWVRATDGPKLEWAIVPRVRVRRPLLALVVLVLALVIGYTVRAVRSDDGGHAPSRSPQPVVSRSR
jgi:hypothetical protein